MLSLFPIACLAPLLVQGPDWTIAPGQTATFSAGGGALELESLTIAAGGVLRFTGDSPVRLSVRGTVRVDGTIDVSGQGFANGIGVPTFNTTNLQEPGRAGGPGGGAGGTGNRIHFASSSLGGAGSSLVPGAGQGGESAFASVGPTSRRAAGGGGGAFGPALPLVHPNPFDPSNDGRVAQDGVGGSPLAFGAISQNAPAVGGSHGAYAFVDADPTNDFWGHRIDSLTLQLVTGELAFPRGGSGGGAGGNSIGSTVFPDPNWSPIGDEKGAGGAGGGGLLIVTARVLEMGPQGRILANGGRGGLGENTANLNGIGGGSGGGSGGMIVIQARRLDLAAAGDDCLSALGGRGGSGADNTPGGYAAGGDGGPGLIQIHVSNGLADILLPGGRTLADLSVPEANVLLPEPQL